MRVSIEEKAAEFSEGGAPLSGQGAACPILLVSPSYPPVVGGSEIEAQQIAAALAQRGCAVDVFTMGGGPMPAVTEFHDPFGTRVFLAGGKLPARLRGYVFGLKTTLHLLFNPRKYRRIYFLMTGFQLLLGLPIARILRIPILMKFSGPNTILPLSKTSIGRLEIEMLRRWSAKILILNDAMQEEAETVGLPARLLAWMPNPVDTERFCPAGENERIILRSQLGLSETEIVLLFVGRLAPEKELPVLIGAFHLVIQSSPATRLVLIGNGPERQMAEDLVAELGLQPHVTFAGVQPHSAIPLWLKAADVFTLVSSLEGFSCSLVEAMSAGLPSVVSDIPANAQLIESGEEGMLTKLRDSRDLANGFLHLIESRSERERMGKAARAKVLERYSISTVTTQYEDLFRSMGQV